MLVTQDQLNLWRQEIDKLSAKIEEHENAIEAIFEKKDQIEELIAMAEHLNQSPHDIEPVQKKTVRERIPKKEVQTTKKKAPAVKRTMRDGQETWPSIISRIVHKEEKGITYQGLKDIINEDLELRERLKESDKGFYHAIHRLNDDGKITKHNSKLFSPKAFKQFQKDVEAGIIEDVPEQTPTAIEEDILVSLLKVYPKSKTGGEISKELEKNPVYRKSLKNGSYIYNVLKRMIVKRESIEKTDNGFRAKIAVNDRN